MSQGTVARTTVWIIIQKEGRVKKSVTSGCGNLKGQEIGVYSMGLEPDTKRKVRLEKIKDNSSFKVGGKEESKKKKAKHFDLEGGN